MLAQTSTRQRILEVVKARLEAIVEGQPSADGVVFATSAGELVFMNETPALGPDDPDIAIAVVVGDDAPNRTGEHVSLELPLELQAIAKADLEEPWAAAEMVLADIKRAMELRDRTLEGLVRPRMERGVTRTLEREPGTPVVGVGIAYLCPYIEQWGAP